jgi:hypothetical protein
MISALDFFEARMVALLFRYPCPYLRARKLDHMAIFMETESATLDIISTELTSNDNTFSIEDVRTRLHEIIARHYGFLQT